MGAHPIEEALAEGISTIELTRVHFATYRAWVTSQRLGYPISGQGGTVLEAIRAARKEEARQWTLIAEDDEP